MEKLFGIGMTVRERVGTRAEPLADRGAKHLEILRETTDALWANAISFYGTYPQPDYGLGFIVAPTTTRL